MCATTRAASFGTRRGAVRASSWCSWRSGFWRTTPNARVAIITDRDELDKQIERVFTEVGEPIKRTNSGRDLMSQLSQAPPRLLCSLIHKFGQRDVGDFEGFINELESQPSKTAGDVFVFVDECHRT